MQFPSVTCPFFYSFICCHSCSPYISLSVPLLCPFMRSQNFYFLSFEKFCTVCNSEIKRICNANNWMNLFSEFISENCRTNFAAKMNHEKMYLDQFYKMDNGDLAEVKKYINRNIMKNLGDSKNGYGTPKEVFVSDFMKLPVTIPEAKTPKPKEPKVYFRFYTQLEDFSAKIWRRFIIDSREKMSTLGSMLISLFEAQGGHLYEFSFENSRKYERMLREKGILGNIIVSIVLSSISSRPQVASCLPYPTS